MHPSLSVVAAVRDSMDPQVDPQSDSSCSTSPRVFPPASYSRPSPPRPSSPAFGVAYAAVADTDSDSAPEMTGATRTKQTTRSTASTTHAKNPPRPPNAWILYRSDKMREMPQPATGEAHRPMAEVSKAISEMWRNETPEVRAQYERISEIRKAEHAELYPNYRFRPIKREEKEKRREEERLMRQRAKAAKQQAKTSRTLSGGSIASNTSQSTSASTGPRPSWTNPANPLAPYLNPRPSPQPAISRVATTSSTATSTIAPTNPKLSNTSLSKSTSSNDPSSSDNIESSSQSSPRPSSAYPPSPIARNPSNLAAPLPGISVSGSWDSNLFVDQPQNFDDLVRDAVRRFEAANSGHELGTPSSTQEYLVDLPDPSFAGFTWDSAPQSSFTFDQNPGGLPTWLASGDPNAFDTGDLSLAWDSNANSSGSSDAPDPLQFTIPDLDYTNFMMNFHPSNTLPGFAGLDGPAFGTNGSDDFIPSQNPTFHFEADDFLNPLDHVAHPNNLASLPEASPDTDMNMEMGEDAPDANASLEVLSEPPVKREETMSAPPSTTNNYAPPAGASNNTTRRVGGDWRRAFAHRIPSSGS